MITVIYHNLNLGKQRNEIIREMRKNKKFIKSTYLSPGNVEQF